jgi:hypothetical protein
MSIDMNTMKPAAGLSAADEAFAQLAINVHQLKHYRASGNTEAAEATKQIIHHYAKTARTHTDSPRSINYLLGEVGMRLIEKEFEYREARTALEDARRDARDDAPGFAIDGINKALEHLDALAVSMGVEL